MPSSEVLNANVADGSTVPAQIAPVAPLLPAADATETASIAPAGPPVAPATLTAPAATEVASVGPQVTVTDRSTGVTRIIPATGVQTAPPTESASAPPTETAPATPTAEIAPAIEIALASPNDAAPVVEPEQPYAPIPMPLSMRPGPMTTPAPVVVATAQPNTTIIAPLPSSPTFVAPRAPLPPPSGYVPFDTSSVPTVGGDGGQVQPWEYGPAEEYVAQQQGPVGEVTYFANGFADSEGNFFFYPDRAPQRRLGQRPLLRPFLGN